MLHTTVLPVTAAAGVLFTACTGLNCRGLCSNNVLAGRLISSSGQQHAFLKKSHSSQSARHAVARNATTQQLARNSTMHVPDMPLKRVYFQVDTYPDTQKGMHLR